MDERSNELAPFAGQLRHLGLDPVEIDRHASLLRDAVRRNQRPSFKIVDTCRLANGGILSLQSFTKVEPADGSGFVAFVPTAGAASRYSQPLFQIVNALEDFDPEDQTAASAAQTTIEQCLGELQKDGALSWPLPPRVRQLIAAPALARTLDAAGRATLLGDLQLPKALLPCVAEGVSFLQMKLREHAEIPGLSGQVFVAPPGRRPDFEGDVAGALPRSLVLEQGPALSTIRFTPEIRPYLDDEGRLSPVPAGHGALAQLFPDVARAYPTAHSLFIRNIDNVMGTKAAPIAATLSFLGVHRALLDGVRRIRAALAKSEVTAAANVARALLAAVPDAGGGAGARLPSGTDVGNPDLQALWELQNRIFHSLPSGRLPSGAAADLEALKALFARPVNTLGQVPNTGKDVGGTPCFVETPHDGLSKLCIEVPHASEADKRDFLANAAKATHFNPVFAAAEITTDPAYYSRRNDVFWLLSEKLHRGKKVVYFETVLYELLGNSRLANCAFVEVPRLVFHPHKTLHDGIAKSLADWIG